jgi:hypothetical protein
MFPAKGDREPQRHRGHRVFFGVEFAMMTEPQKENYYEIS